MDKNNDIKYVSGKKASEILGVHQRTLYSWDKKGLIETIRTPGNKRMYNVDKFLKSKKKDLPVEYDINKIDQLLTTNKKLDISYARVSSHSQTDDLEHQKKNSKILP